jgi:hypothetical protein
MQALISLIAEPFGRRRVAYWQMAVSWRIVREKKLSLHETFIKNLQR